VTVKATTYQICVQGFLDEARIMMFADVSICYVNDNSLITAVLPDQSALYGFLNRLRDLGVTLISLHQVKNRSDGFAEKTNRRVAEGTE
jgi:hypothetical protein